jgi:general secretion pathway protein F
MRPSVAAESARVARDLSGLLELGYPPLEALGKLASSTGGEYRLRLDKLVERMRTGSTLGTALAGDCAPFPQVFADSLRLAENSGDLPGALRQVADVLEESAERSMACYLATVYPAVIGSVLALLVWGVVGLFGHEYQQFARAVAAEPPLVARMFFGLASFLRHPLGILALLGLVVLIWKLFTSSPLRYRIPIFGSWLSGCQAVLLLRWTDHLHRLGCPLPQALALASSACEPTLGQSYARAATEVEGGASLSQALERCREFPRMGLWLIRQEEDRERLELGSVADFLRWELDTTEARGTAAIEPVALIVLGLLALFVGLTINGTLYSLLRNLA